MEMLLATAGWSTSLSDGLWHWVQDATTIVTDDKKAIQHTERDRWHGEEVHRSNRFPVITEKGKPAPG
jgi:hypothetical protein